MAAIARLTAERKDWRKDRPEHFVAKPKTREDGTSNLLEWEVKIPAKPNSIWAPGLYPATITFTDEYPDKPPKVKFHKINGQPIFHPNVFVDGNVCLSIINPPESMHGCARAPPLRTRRAAS